MGAEAGDRRLRVLLVEDDGDDYLLTRGLLAKIPGAEVGTALTREVDPGAALTARSRSACPSSD